MAVNTAAAGLGGTAVALPQAVLDLYSIDILHEAQGVMRFEDFAVRRMDLMQAPGNKVIFTRYKNIGRGGALTENTPMGTKAMSADTIDVTVGEYGNALAVTEMLVRSTWDNLLAEQAVLLGRDYATVRDLAIREALEAGGNTLFVNSRASKNDLLATDLLDTKTISRAVEALRTANAPKIRGDYYVCFAHPHQIASIQSDPEWTAAHNYHATRALFNGEVGRWHDVIFIETTHISNGAAYEGEEGVDPDPGYDATLDASLDANPDMEVDGYRAILVADQAYAVADALPAEMRDNGVEDFGRVHKLGWYGIWGQKILNGDHVYHLISA